ncbi:hypothetical protein [Vibrio mediterranei]|uniref:hypothetical protein n=1 Tax=Vibrio mediterranei TaxID=689 RepID=UPI0040682724
MKNNCCYEMAKDIFIYHLGMSEIEAKKQLASMFPNGQFESLLHQVGESKEQHDSEFKKV